jgi:hypothetical protein
MIGHTVTPGRLRDEKSKLQRRKNAIKMVLQLQPRAAKAVERLKSVKWSIKKICDEEKSSTWERSKNVGQSGQGGGKYVHSWDNVQ